MQYGLVCMALVAFTPAITATYQQPVVLYPFEVPTTIKIHGGMETPPHELKVKLHVRDFKNIPMNPNAFTLRFANGTNYGRYELEYFYCHFPRNMSATPNQHLTCSMNITSYLPSETLTLESVDLYDTQGNGLIGNAAYGNLLKNLNAALAGRSKMKFNALPSVSIVQTGQVDTTAPIFEKVTIPKTFYIGPSGHAVVKMHVQATDNKQSGVQWDETFLSFRNIEHPEAKQISCDDWYNMTRTHATCVIHLNEVHRTNNGGGGNPGRPTLANGTYVLSGVRTEDHASNVWDTGYNTDPTQLLAAINARLPAGHKLMKLPSVKLVIDHRVDTTPPVIHSIVVHPKNVTATHASVGVTFRIGDDISGINLHSLYAQFDNGIEDYGKRKTATCVFPKQNEQQVERVGRRIMFTTVTCKVTLPKGSESGNYSLSDIYVADEQDNVFYSCCSPPNPGGFCGCDILQSINALLPKNEQLPALPSFEFTDTGPVDSQPPILHSLTVVPNNPSSNGTINVTAKFTDNLSGVDVSSIDMTFFGPSNDVFCSDWHKASMGPLTNVRVTCSNQLGEIGAGLYMLGHVYVYDMVGNKWNAYGSSTNATVLLNQINKRLPMGSKWKKLPSFTVHKA